MEEKFSANKNVALRVKDFLEKISPYEYKYGDFIITCYILGLLGDPVAVPSLINLLKKCGEIHSTRIEKNMEIFEQTRIRIARIPLKAVSNALIRIGGEAVQPLIELLNSEHPETRKYAAYTLGKIGDRKAYKSLKKIFTDPKEMELVREVAARAMLQLDPEKAAKTVRADSLTPPTEDPLSQGFDKIHLELHLEVVNKYYPSLDDLGPPSEYRLSVSIYKYLEKMVDNLEDAKIIRKNWREFILPKPEIQELNLPQEIIEEIDKIDEHSLPCLCGEYLEWAYVKSLSKRIWKPPDDKDRDYRVKIEDVICVYCKNCKRYAGIRKSTDDTYPTEKTIYYYWFYLPRFPKQTEQINEEELEEKPITWETTTEEEDDEDEEDEEES